MSNDTDQTRDQINILESIKDAQLELKVILIEKEFPIGELSHLIPGSVLPFNQGVNTLSELTVNGKKFAKGTVVKAGEHYGLKIDELHP